MRQRGLAGGGRRAQVHAVERVPGVDRAVRERFPAEAAGHVHEAVEAAQAFGGARHRGTRSFRIRKVDASHEHGVAEPARPGRFGLVDGRDPRARGLYGAHHDRAERAERAGDGDELSCEGHGALRIRGCAG